MSDAEIMDDDIDEISGANSSVTRCASVTFRIVFSTPGLVVLVVIYSVLGALIFPLLEGPMELQTSVSISKSREDCLKELWTITERLNVLYERNWTLLVHDQLRRFEGSIVAATKVGLTDSLSDSRFPRWSFSESLLYSVTVITTIGHGNLSPKTSGGKIVTMLYALIGVPLMLMCLSSLGNLLADGLQGSYIRLCRRGRQHRDSAVHRHDRTQEHCGSNYKYDDLKRKEQNTTKQKYDKYTPVTGQEDSFQLIKCTPTNMCHPNQSPHLTTSTYGRIKTPMDAHNYTITTDDHQLNQSPKHQHHLHQTAQQYRIVGMANSGAYFSLKRLPSEQQQQLQQHQHQQQQQQQQQQCQNHQSHHQINAKYHEIVMQSDKNRTLHTATVHGLGRSKFLPKPLPHEINMLLAECETSCDLSTATGLSIGSVKCNYDQLDGGDDDDEDATSAGCPHGTPSRIPLIRQQHSPEMKYHGSHNHSMQQQQQQQQRPINDVNNLQQSSALGGETALTDDVYACESTGNGAALGGGGACSSSSSNNNNAHRTNSTGDGAVAGMDTVSNRNGPQVPITLILTILISYITIGTVIFSMWENWSIVDGAYFCFVTLSTIGFGDLMPRKTFRGPEIQLFACCAYLVLGLVLVAMSFTLLETQLMWKCRRIAVRLKLAKD